MGSIFKIGTRLGFGFMAMIAILIAFAWFSTSKMKSLSQQTGELYHHPFVVSATLGRINTNIIKMHRAMKDIALTADIEKSQRDIAAVDELQMKILDDFRIIGKEFPGTNADETALKLFTDWKVIREEVFSLIRAGKIPEAAGITKGKGAAQVAGIESAMETLGEAAALNASDLLDNSGRIRQRTLNEMYLLLIGSMIIASSISIYLSKSISNPIESVKQAIEDFGKGNRNAKIIVDSKDELGKLAQAFNQMAEDLLEVTASRDELNMEIAKRKEYEEDLKGNTERLQMLWELSQDNDATENDLLSRGLEACVSLTKSEVGYMHLFDETFEEITLKMWSKGTADNCTVNAESHYPLSSAGIWADSVRNKMPAVHNDYPARADKKGYPDGHFPVKRHVSIPVVDKGKIVAIAGSGNKNEPYSEKDIQQLQLFMNNLWLVIETKRTLIQIKKALAEKEVLLREVHHRVKNNMAVISSLLSLQSKYLHDKRDLDMFMESQSRIRSMALIHERLYRNRDCVNIDVKDYVTSLLRGIQSTFSVDSRIKVKMDIERINPDIDTLIPCGLIINELLTNAFKYAFTGSDSPEISISLKHAAPGYAVLAVSDNGVGLPEGFDISRSTGLGLQIISTLSNQINGRLEVENRGGAVFTLTFPEKIGQA